MVVKFRPLFLTLNVFMLIDTFVLAQNPSYFDFTALPQYNSASGCIRSCIGSATNAVGVRIGCNQSPVPATCICGTDFQETSSFYSYAGDCAITSCPSFEDVYTASSIAISYCTGNSAIEAKATGSMGAEICFGTVPGSTAPSTAPSTTMANSAPSSTGSGGDNSNNGNMNQNVSIGGGSNSGLPQSDRIALGVGLGIGIPTVLFGAWGIWV
ncbi:hypothetical protein EV356DRAFT_506440 [Viridothelium virens]|uniref:Extracellular membrane protein CFEM domain-containing protein n=1 Tax=Viridothelium virens TaxID=1048519 RepID=A0A6A6H164_VIRVR|nr:hypothetical protein EV356DRAFT_506440 [Viridothelium virens]